MNAKVYVLLRVKEGKSEQAVQTLRSKDGVRLLDALEGPPNIIMMIQARERRRLAELTVEAIASVENITEDLQLLPTQDGCCASVLTKSVGIRRNRQGRESNHGKKR